MLNDLSLLFTDHPYVAWPGLVVTMAIVVGFAYLMNRAHQSAINSAPPRGTVSYLYWYASYEWSETHKRRVFKWMLAGGTIDKRTTVLLDIDRSVLLSFVRRQLTSGQILSSVVIFDAEGKTHDVIDLKVEDDLPAFDWLEA